MLKFEKVLENEHTLIYKYICEGKTGEEYEGNVHFSLDDGEVSIVDKAKYDEFGLYWGHLASHLRKMHEEGKFEELGIIAWY